MNTDYTKSVNVKKVPFDGTEASFFFWTTQIVGFAETYNCEQALMGSITVPPSSAGFCDTEPAEKKLLMGRNANSTAMVILHNPSQMTVQFFTFRAPVLRLCCTRKAWLDLHMMFYPVSTE
jgi:hypothetical protein